MTLKTTDVIVKETVKRDCTFDSTLNEVRQLVNSGTEKGKTKNGISFIKILNTIVLF